MLVSVTNWLWPLLSLWAKVGLFLEHVEYVLLVLFLVLLGFFPPFFFVVFLFHAPYSLSPCLLYPVSLVALPAFQKPSRFFFLITIIII